MESAAFHGNFDAFFDKLELEQPDASWTGERRLLAGGRGGVRRYSPRSDMAIVLSDYEFHASRVIPLTAAAPMVELNIGWQGTREIAAGGETHGFGPGMCSLQFVNPTDVRFQFGAGEPTRMLSVAIPAGTFDRSMMDAKRGRSGPEFAAIIGRKPLHIYQEKIPASLKLVAERLLGSASRDGVRNFELECLASELLGESFRLFLDRGADEADSGLSRRDAQAIREAAAILASRLADAPGLLELARQVGVNDNKLKLGFKKLYGTTVFGYLRDRRLEKALDLLRCGEFNVYETSLEVGYSNPSHFAEAFRSKYGVNPGELLRGGSRSRFI
ncbi:helix-turn-helix transcriptional regulator [Cohnella fermenti]|uniref:helix-turn-helix transcriptional regulator n=1 Tax=Cohnella fermenti TaxID=2565925 RepID=UPI001454CEAB|nr:AraC family transcriptional regulator [Cohnella fermenti]